MTLRLTFYLALDLTLKAKCKAKGHGFISCSGSLAIILDSGGGRCFQVGGKPMRKGPESAGPLLEPRGPQRLMKGPWLPTAPECEAGFL